jgi:membrane protein YdbS with pleckstrin-like domain
MMMRLITGVAMIPVMVGALVAEKLLEQVEWWPRGVIAGVVLLLAVVLILRVPSRRYGARGYDMGTDRLRVVRGVLFHSDTVVPFGRVQHIDVSQGPLERLFSIATLTLHTAGNHNASVHLPGLEQELAKDLREEIRAHIKRESL